MKKLLAILITLASFSSYAQEIPVVLRYYSIQDGVDCPRDAHNALAQFAKETKEHNNGMDCRMKKILNGNNTNGIALGQLFCMNSKAEIHMSMVYVKCGKFRIQVEPGDFQEINQWIQGRWFDDVPLDQLL